MQFTLISFFGFAWHSAKKNDRGLCTRHKISQFQSHLIFINFFSTDTGVGWIARLSSTLLASYVEYCFVDINGGLSAMNYASYDGRVAQNTERGTDIFL